MILNPVYLPVGHSVYLEGPSHPHLPWPLSAYWSSFVCRCYLFCGIFSRTYEILNLPNQWQILWLYAPIGLFIGYLMGPQLAHMKALCKLGRSVPAKLWGSVSSCKTGQMKCGLDFNLVGLNLLVWSGSLMQWKTLFNCTCWSWELITIIMIALLMPQSLPPAGEFPEGSWVN